jgi:FKBP-type peptidyl-prolyl cis-trans isomerase
MNPFNKFEAAGIFISVAFMAVALAFVRFGTDTFDTVSRGSGESNRATVIAVGVPEAELKDKLTDSVDVKGELKKLVVNDVTYGTGVTVNEGDTVTVHYKGTLTDGQVFDDSRVRGEPFSFTVGEGEVIQGWEEGLLGMQVGGERILVIPPTMAYGNREVGIIPANATLLFAIELLSIE